jgi:hypothetical protein
VAIIDKFGKKGTISTGVSHVDLETEGRNTRGCSSFEVCTVLLQ